MTFSIVGWQDGAAGVAVASKFLAAGAVVPVAQVGVGAVATQSYAKWSYRADCLALLAAGASAQEAIDRVTGADESRDQRQLGVVGPGGAATFTGTQCHGWAGGRCGGDAATGWYAVQGNILVGPEVIDAMEQAWHAAQGGDLARRLLAALAAGDAAGGDRRGRQAAALYVVAEGAGYDGNAVAVDLRVDDHPHATTELARLLDLSDLYFGQPQDVQPLDGTLLTEVQERLATLGHHDDDVHAALADWAGIENLELRLTPEGIDRRVLDHLRARTA